MNNKQLNKMGNNQTSTMKNRILIITTLLLIGIAFWVLNYLTPEFRDDYSYKFIFGEIPVDPCHRPFIKTFKDIFVSQYNHYFIANGRSIVHCFVQLFTGILGKNVFNIANTIVFLIFICVMVRLNTQITSFKIFFTCCIIFLLFPIFKETALWMTGSINYLWSSTLICIFIFLIEKYKREILSIKHVLYGIPCILIGWTHEGITLPLSISLIIYIILNYKSVYKQATFPLIIGFIIGTCLCTFAPGTMNRASENGKVMDILIISEFIQRICSGFILCLQLKALNTLLCTFIILLCMKRISFLWIKAFYRKNFIIFNALFFSLGMVFLLGGKYVRMAIGVELFSIILFLRIIVQYCKSSILKNIKIGIGVASCILYTVIMYYSINNYKEYKYILSQLQLKKDNKIIVNEIHPPFYIDSYVLTYLDDSRIDLHNWYFYDYSWNTVIARTYRYDSLVFVPTMVYDDIINHNDRINDIQQQKNYPFYVMPINSTTDGINPTFILRPTDFQHLPFYIRPIAHKMFRYTATEIPTSRYGIINIQGQNYIFITKNDAIDDRVESISLK